MPDPITPPPAPGAPVQTTTGAAAGVEAPAPVAETLDADALRKEVAQTRKEAAEYRRKLREFELAQADAEAAKLSEAEKLKKQVADLSAKLTAAEQERQERTLRAAVEKAAAKLGIVDADAAYLLLDKSALAVDEAGKVSGAEQAISALVQARPWLVQAAPTSAANPARGASSRLSLDDVRRMGPDEINARWDEISQVLAQK